MVFIGVFEEFAFAFVRSVSEGKERFKGKRGGRAELHLPGEELFTVVLPDNKVVNKVFQTLGFTERLSTPWKHYPELKQRRGAAGHRALAFGYWDVLRNAIKIKITSKRKNRRRSRRSWSSANRASAEEKATSGQ